MNAKPIGGFFELELPNSGTSYHPDALALSTGRACIRLILQQLNVSKCYLPFYTCDAVCHPFLLEGVPVEFYRIDHRMDPMDLPVLQENEYFLYINFFGLKSSTIERLIEKYGSRLLIDNTHLFFHKGYSNNWTFTSARKHFGVPDGAYLFTPTKLLQKLDRFQHVSANHNILRLLGLQQESYAEYVKFENTLNSEIFAISTLSEKLLSLIDYEQVQKRRRSNFDFLHEELGAINQFSIGTPTAEVVPFAYPLLPGKPLDKTLFYKENVFVPSLWLDPLQRDGAGFEFEKLLGKNLLPLPIDHRYEIRDMERMVALIRRLL